MRERQKRKLFIGAVIISCLVAIAVVWWRNKLLWDLEPYPGGQSARNYVVEFESPWITTGISELQWRYSPWLGLLIVQALIGTAGSALFVPAKISPLLCCCFLYSFVAFVLSMLLIPLLLGFVGLTICWVIAARRKIAGADRWLFFCLWHNCLLTIVSFAYFSQMFSVYGD